MRIVIWRSSCGNMSAGSERTTILVRLPARADKYTTDDLTVRQEEVHDKEFH